MRIWVSLNSFLDTSWCARVEDPRETLSQFLPGYFPLCTLPRVAGAPWLSIPSWILLERYSPVYCPVICSQFLPGYFTSSTKPCTWLASALSIPSWILPTKSSMKSRASATLNSFLDTSEGLYRCYIRLGGIYVYPPIELKYLILKNRVDQRT